MTLRVTIAIVPFGDEAIKDDLFRMDISNTGLLRDEGFGHQYCSYDVKVYRHNNEVMQMILEADEWELEAEAKVDSHNRRDGAFALVQKASKLMEDKV